MHTSNTIVEMRGDTSATARRSIVGRIQDSTYGHLKEIVNMHGANLSLYRY